MGLLKELKTEMWSEPSINWTIIPCKLARVQNVSTSYLRSDARGESIPVCGSLVSLFRKAIQTPDFAGRAGRFQPFSADEDSRIPGTAREKV